MDLKNLKIPRPFKNPNSVPTRHYIKRDDDQTSAYTLHRAYYQFKVKEYVDGTPWIYFDLLVEPNLPIFGEGSLGFDLPHGTSYQQGMKVADFLNDHIKCVRATMVLRAKVLPMKKIILALLAICALIGILLIWWFATPHAVSVPKQATPLLRRCHAAAAIIDTCYHSCPCPFTFMAALGLEEILFGTSSCLGNGGNFLRLIQDIAPNLTYSAR